MDVFLNKLRKKILFILFLIPINTFASSESKTETSHFIPKLIDGYYVAVFVGYDNYRMQDNIVYHGQLVSGEVELDPVVAVTGVAGNFTIGYGKYFGSSRSFYLGIETFVCGSGADNDFQMTIPDLSLQVDTDVIVETSFGIALIPGYKFNHSTMIYLKLGYGGSLVSVEEVTRVKSGYEIFTTEYDVDSTVRGFLYGIGIESMFNEQFSLRAEYSHSSYNSFYADAHTQMIPDDNQFLLGLVYRFNI